MKGTTQFVRIRGLTASLLRGGAMVTAMLNAEVALAAQTVASPPSLPSGSSAAPTSTGLEEIVVTAQRRAETAQRAAIAIAVVSGDSVAKAGISKSSDLGNLVPAVQIANNGGSNTSFFLRGVGAFTSNSYTDPTIAFNYDGVYVGRPAGTSGVFYDLERVEVLKGPQGTLYGRNATGGAINVLPAKPEIGRTGGSASLSYGNYDAVNVQGAVNIAVSDDAAARVSGTYVHRNGYLSDGTSDDNGYALRAQFLAKPTSNLTARLAADFYHAGGRGGGASYLARTAYDPSTQAYTISPSGLSPEIGLLDPRSSVFRSQTYSGLSGRTLLPLQRQPNLDNDTVGVNAEINWVNPLGTLTVIPAYRLFRQRGIQDALGLLISTDETDRQYSLEARLATDANKPLSAVLGGYFYKEDVRSVFNIYQQVFDSFQTFDQSSRSLAAFGRATFKISDRIRLVGGGRFTSDRKTFDGAANLLIDTCNSRAGCPGAPLMPFTATIPQAISELGLVPANPSAGIYVRPGDPTAANTIFVRGVTPVDGSRTDAKFTYRIGAEADVGPRSLVYASYETGFRSGGFAFALLRPTFGPEQIQAFTIGSKNRFFGDRLQLNLEAFYWKYRDQQVSHLGADSNRITAYFTENIGRSTNKGLELEIQARPVRNTRLYGDVQYLHARYDDFVYDAPAYAGGNPAPPPLVGCAVTKPTVVTPTSAYTVNCSGKQAYRSPTWTVNFGVTQTVALGGLELVGDVNTHFQSANNTGFDFLDIERVGSYWISNASLTINGLTRGVTLSAFVDNLENNRKGTFSFYNGPTSTISETTTPPRTFGVRIGAKF
jgi:iron complex outermembrane recepter protein